MLSTLSKPCTREEATNAVRKKIIRPFQRTIALLYQSACRLTEGFPTAILQLTTRQAMGYRSVSEAMEEKSLSLISVSCKASR
jgi:hypothetical protein